MLSVSCFWLLRCCGRADAARIVGLGMAAEHVIIVPEAVDTAVFDPATAPALSKSKRQQYGVGGSILFVPPAHVDRPAPCPAPPLAPSARHVLAFVATLMQW